MRRLVRCVSLLIVLACPTLGDGAESPSAPRSKADRPPRKVVVGTAIFGPYGKYPGLDERLKVLGGLIDEMARQAAAKYPGRGLDLAILPETTVTSTSGPASRRAVPLDGPVRETFGALARKHKTYIVAPMDLAEEGPEGTSYSNAAVLFDRKGEVAGHLPQGPPGRRASAPTSWRAGSRRAGSTPSSTATSAGSASRSAGTSSSTTAGRPWPRRGPRSSPGPPPPRRPPSPPRGRPGIATTSCRAPGARTPRSSSRPAWSPPRSRDRHEVLVHQTRPELRRPRLVGPAPQTARP